MAIAETPHGPIEYQSSQVFCMDGGLVGFCDATRFVLIENSEVEPLRWLVSVDRPELAFLVVDPRLLIPDFRVHLRDEERMRLELTDDDDVLLLAITVVGETSEEATANLKAPIVVNPRKMTAAQVVLIDSEYSVHQPLLAASAG